MTTKEAADYLHVSIRTFKYWIKANNIRPVQTGARGTKFYSPVQLNNFRSAMTCANVNQFCTTEFEMVDNCTRQKNEKSKMENNTMKYNYNSLPFGLTNKKNFVMFKIENDKDGKPTKRPYNALTGNLAEVNNPDTWATFEQALETYNQGNYNGIGYVFDGKDIVGIDIDHCIDDNGKLSNSALELITKCNSYSELSPSNKGVHIFLDDETAAHFFNQRQKTGKKFKNGVEIYCTRRFFTLTGNHIKDTPKNIIQNCIIKELVERFENEENNTDNKIKMDSPIADKINQQNTTMNTSTLSDDVIISKIQNSKQADLFEKLFYNGDISDYVDNEGRPDHNRADLALLNIFAFWTGKDYYQMERLFGQSKLGQRQKWITRNDYRQMSIDKAIFDCSSTYNSNFEPNAQINNDNYKNNPLNLSDETLEKLMHFRQSDWGNAERLVTAYGQSHIYYLTDSNKWLNYYGTKWKPAKNCYNSSVNNLVVNLAQQLRTYAKTKEAQYIKEFNTYKQNEETAETNDKAANAETNKNIASSIIKLANKLEKRANIDNAVYLAKSIDSIRITEDDLNTHKNLFNCKNGVIDLETGKLYPHKPESLFTQCANVIYIPTYHSMVFDNFIASTLPNEEVRETLLMFLGYCLTGSVREDKALFIHGGGRNGKGSLIAALMKCFGDFATTFKIDVLLQNARCKDGDAATPEFNKLLHTRLAIADEIPHGRLLDVPKFKLLTGGDAIPVRRLHEESSTIFPTHKLMLSGNALPEIKDTREIALIERLLVIRFEQTFIGENRNVNLREQLLTDESLSGMFTSLVEHCIKWFKNGTLIEPDSVKTFKNDYLDENDLIGDFINEYCEFDVNASIRRNEFIDKIKENGKIGGMRDKAIIDAVVKIDKIQYKKTMYGRSICGIKWKTNKDEKPTSIDDINCPF